jgi:Iap family predicted aminopeptidase
MRQLELPKSLTIPVQYQHKRSRNTHTHTHTTNLIVRSAKSLATSGRNFDTRHMRNVYNILVGEVEGKRLHDRSRSKLKDDTAMDQTYGEMWTGFIRFRIKTSGGLL